MKLFLDFETRSAVELTEVGLWSYALHPSTQITCMGWGADASCVQVFGGRDVGYDWGRISIPHLGKDVIVGHNVSFEYACYNLILHRRYGWPARWDPALWSCTLARAAVCGLPLGLDQLGRALNTKTPKDLEGRAVMLALSKPLYVDPLFGPVFNESPADHKRLYAYNKIDVLADIEIDSYLPELSPFERRVWELDLVMNRRGVQVDIEFARRASVLSNRLIVDLNTRLHGMTCTASIPCAPKTCTGIDKATRVAAIKDFLKDRYEITALTLDKEAVTTLLDNPKTPAPVREILKIRRQVGKKNSIAKYTSALAMTSPDGRARGMFQYSAAHTRRWGGRGIQPQNFPKGFKAKEQAAAIAAIMEGSSGVTLDMLSDALRGVFIAAPGKKLVCADFNAIEARVLFWLAGVQRALNAYARGESPYLDMARTIYKREDLSKEGTPQEYDMGKRTILGCGYGMGAETFRTNVYAETAKTGKAVSITQELAEAAVKAYRDKYPEIRNLWYEVERAAVNAARSSPETLFTCCGGRVMWGVTPDRRFLACRLPSGEFLRYFKPSVKLRLTPWGEEKEAVHYWAINPDTKQWEELNTYGGALVENITQATARDLMAQGMLNVQAAGYDVVATVHDEAVAEHAAPNLNEFIAALCKTPPWATGCPVAAEGWIRERYGK